MADAGRISDKKQEGISIHLLLTIFIVFWMNGGTLTFLNGIFGFKYIKFMIVILWMGMASTRDPKFFSKYFKVISPLLLFMVFAYFEKFLAYDDEYIKNADMIINNVVFLLITTAIFVFYITNDCQKEKKAILKAWFIDIIICGIITIVELEKEPMLSRILATADPTEYTGRDILPKGLLSFGNAYSFVFCIFALCLYLEKRHKTNRTAVVAMMLFLFFLIIEMQFAISLFMAILAIILFWGVKRFQDGKGIAVAFVLPIILILVYSFSESIIDYLISLVEENEALTVRLEEVKSFALSENLKGTDLESRFIRYSDSFDAIFSNYFMGNLLMGNGKVGGHSDLLDIAAIFGLIPFLCIWSYFKAIYKETKKVLLPSYCGLLKTGFFLFGILSIVNTSLWSQIMIVLVLIVPLLFQNASNKRKIEEEKNKGSEKGEVKV